MAKLEHITSEASIKGILPEGLVTANILWGHNFILIQCFTDPAAADLLRQLGAAGEIASDLAYRLYNICERKKWPAEALAYNSLVIAWPEIAQLARSTPAAPQMQEKLFK